MTEPVTLEWIMELATEAGMHIRDALSRDKLVEFKGENDLVTATDKAVEAALIGKIRARYPDHAFLAEESSADGKKPLTDVETWIIDPVDGTTNFVHGFPFVAVSIAYAVGRQVVMGVVYNPILNEMFSAQRGKGAFLNGQPIRTSGQTNIGRSLIATGFNAYIIGQERSTGKFASSGLPYAPGLPPTKETLLPLPSSHALESTMNNVRAAVCLGQDVRRAGSAALDMCYVACGRLDMYFEWGPHEWDFAAGLVIVEEAGGFVSKFDLTDFTLECRECIVSATRDIAAMISPYLQRPI